MVQEILVSGKGAEENEEVVLRIKGPAVSVSRDEEGIKVKIARHDPKLVVEAINVVHDALKDRGYPGIPSEDRDDIREYLTWGTPLPPKVTRKAKPTGPRHRLVRGRIFPCEEIVTSDPDKIKKLEDRGYRDIGPVPRRYGGK